MTFFALLVIISYRCICLGFVVTQIIILQFLGKLYKYNEYTLPKSVYLQFFSGYQDMFIKLHPTWDTHAHTQIRDWCSRANVQGTQNTRSRGTRAASKKRWNWLRELTNRDSKSVRICTVLFMITFGILFQVEECHFVVFILFFFFCCCSFWACVVSRQDSPKYLWGRELLSGCGGILLPTLASSSSSSSCALPSYSSSRGPAGRWCRCRPRRWRRWRPSARRPFPADTCNKTRSSLGRRIKMHQSRKDSMTENEYDTFLKHTKKMSFISWKYTFLPYHSELISFIKLLFFVNSLWCIVRIFRLKSPTAAV